ncbi:jg18654 [Pararge aegeria aegeria]|uniref:Jg18654 protein n=1 Tax=Pararge aegeria aegeria TaxID=348720 RepID=A0A8S4RDT5_9NEOP|nr:jg18654 [Pararge aegeria aegeria]
MFLRDGDRGYLEGLASRYADLFSTHYGDVLDHLEELRRHEWEEMSPRMRVLGGTGTPQTPPSASPGSLALSNLTTSHSQPIYVPGKYSPSSCLNDKEEDEIYGFGYGVFGKQMLQRQQQQKQLLLAQPNQPLIHNQQHNYQSCLSPRSAYFYEFPPSGEFYLIQRRYKYLENERSQMIVRILI